MKKLWTSNDSNVGLRKKDEKGLAQNVWARWNTYDMWQFKNVTISIRVCPEIGEIPPKLPSKTEQKWWSTLGIVGRLPVPHFWDNPKWYHITHGVWEYSNITSKRCHSDTHHKWIKAYIWKGQKSQPAPLRRTPSGAFCTASPDVSVTGAVVPCAGLERKPPELWCHGWKTRSLHGFTCGTALVEEKKRLWGVRFIVGFTMGGSGII